MCHGNQRGDWGNAANSLRRAELRQNTSALADGAQADRNGTRSALLVPAGETRRFSSPKSSSPQLWSESKMNLYRNHFGELVIYRVDHQESTYPAGLRFKGEVKSCSMRKSPASGIISTTTITVLSVSPMAEDHTSLSTIFEQSELTCSDSKWQLRPCATVESAIGALCHERIPLIVTERDLAPGSWREILENILLLPDPPVLIVTSRLADEYLWAEALNLGAHDVLAKPFDTSEVVRVLGSAWRHWTELHDHNQVRHPQRMLGTGAA
jgi:CheY-like chemotaxis protein